ncbi:ATP-dependent nuclease [Lactococcus piscium]|uniref:Putative ATPase n=1 Tax=Pseudolactococcus piscium MKFS47 TaxID=297352 RepID=A0A0D6DZZ6_9LACT|nr:ATP-binding protein [Lactococcus piscium]CEN29361.1 Putative ATPase [Lactococcus piscium MKFS47]
MLKNIQTTLINQLQTKTTLEITNVNIFVGPNSSGKSIFLKELNNYLTLSNVEFNNNYDAKIIDTIEFSSITLEDQLQYINSLGGSINKEQYNADNWNSLRLDNFSYNIAISPIYNAFNSSESNRDRVEYFDNFFTLYLNGQTRLTMLQSIDFSPYDKSLLSPFAKMYHHKDLYDEFKEYIKDAFDLFTYFRIDGSYIEFVFSRTSAPEDFDEFSLKPESTEFLKKCLTHNDLSDGQRSYIGILLQLLAGNPETIIIDEVEAFLHPPLARKLGSLISKIANDTNKQIFLSTHSPNIILGAIQSGAKTNIIRLTYDGTIGRSTIIDSKHLTSIMAHPLIRSTSFLDALFYKNAIVTESDSDRAFYQEINFRLSKFTPEKSITDCIFLNAQNKQTVGTLVRELRNLGVPTASIIDLDFIKDGGSVFTEYLSSVNIPKTLHKTIETSKTTVQNYYKNLHDDFKTLKSKGISALQGEDLSPAELLLETLGKYGQFPVPVGELECWLPQVESHNHGSKWLIKKFENLGFDEFSSDYIKPENNDVWEFISKINQWLENSQRSGMLSTN